MPDTKEKKETLKAELSKLGLPQCAACSASENLHRGYDGVLLYCLVNAPYRDVSPWLTLSEAAQCPGKGLRRLFLGAPTFYADRRQDDS